MGSVSQHLEAGNASEVLGVASHEGRGVLDRPGSDPQVRLGATAECRPLPQVRHDPCVTKSGLDTDVADPEEPKELERVGEPGGRDRGSALEKLSRRVRRHCELLAFATGDEVARRRVKIAPRAPEVDQEGRVNADQVAASLRQPDSRR